MISLHVVSLLVVALGFVVWWARPSSPTNRSFGVFCCVSALWILGVAFFHSGTSTSVWAPVAFAAASLIPAAFLAFIRHYPIPTHWPSTWVLRVNLVIGLMFAAISLTTSLVASAPTVTPIGPSRETGPLYPFFAAYFLAAWLMAWSVFVVSWARARGLARVQLHYVAFGFLFVSIGGTISNLVHPLLTGNGAYTWLGPHFAFAFVALVAHAIIRHRLMEVRLVIHRSLTFALALLLSLLPVVGLLALVWPKLSDHLDPQELVALVAAVALVSLLIPLTRDVAARLLDRYVYRTRVNYQRTLRDASAALARVLDLRLLLDFLNNTVATAMDVEGVTVYLDTFSAKHASRFSRAIEVKRLSQSGFYAPQEIPQEIVAVLTATKDLLVADEVPHQRRTGDRDRLHDVLTDLNWALVLPLVSENTVIGAIVVGPKRSGDPFYPQDLDLLMTLANQAGVAVKNAQLYAQVVLANEHLNNIVSTIESGVVAIGVDGQVTLFNRAAEQLTGIPADRARHQPVDVLPACLTGMLTETVGDGSARTQPDIELPDGVTTRPIICATSPLYDPTGTVLGAVAVFSDLTPLKQLEVERRRAERVADFEMLASGIAHEIKNPLVSIKTFAQLLPRRYGDERFIENFGRIVMHQIGRMEELLDRLRTLSRPSSRRLQPIDLRAPISDAIEAVLPAFSEKNVILTAAVGQAPSVVLGDHSELEQLFLNLLINALEATPPAGMVRVEVVRSGDRAIVAVVDTGSGIAAEHQERVFDPFFTTKEHGSGLGLAICASIAETHGARLKATNRDAGGAVVTFDCPLVVAATRPVPT
jgi:two-component system, NtrC family, sensor kinase